MDEKKIRHGNTQKNKESSSGHGGKRPWRTTIAFVIGAAVAVVTVISNSKNSARINETAGNGSSSGGALYAETTSTATISAPLSPTYTFEPTDFPSATPTVSSTPESIDAPPEIEEVTYQVGENKYRSMNSYNADQGGLLLKQVIVTDGCLENVDRFELINGEFDIVFNDELINLPGIGNYGIGYLTYIDPTNPQVKYRMMIHGIDPDDRGPRSIITWLDENKKVKTAQIRASFHDVYGGVSGFTINGKPVPRYVIDGSGSSSGLQ